MDRPAHPDKKRPFPTVSSAARRSSAAALALCLAAAAHAAPQGRRFCGKPIPYAGLPAQKEGRFPIATPRYEGVDQLLILSSRWLIAATTDAAEVVKKIDELSGGEYLRMLDAWERSAAAGRPDWRAYKALPRLRKRYLRRARESAGERELGRAEFFSFTSPDDPAYARPRRPSRATCVYVSLGGRRVRGEGAIHYAIYSYLETPRPLVSGKHYVLALGNGKRAAFLYDEMRTVSRAIKVNQVGYLPDAAKKYAYLGAYLYKFGPLDFSYAKQFRVVNARTGETALTGPVRLREKNPRFAPNRRHPDPSTRPLICGEDVYEMDLSGLKEEGEFFISIPGVGRSWTFRHARDAYGEAFYIACRGLYHQRCGVALDAARTAWTRPRCHAEPVYESEHIVFPPHLVERPKGYNRFDVIGATTDTTRKTENVVGGWHDAADWDRNLYHYACIFDLLNAYELWPRKFTDGQLNLPESGDGTPDILDEAEFGLRVWRRSQDARGGVAGAVETWTHPRIDDPNVKYSFSRRTRWSSLLYAAAAAQYARLVKPFDPAGAREYAASARRAYAFGADSANSLGQVVIHARKRRGRGEPYTIRWEEKDEYNRPYLAAAKVQMYLLTEDKNYLKGLAALSKAAYPPFKWRFGHQDFSAWLYFALAAGAGGDAETTGRWRSFYLRAAEELERCCERMPYRFTWPRAQDYYMGWGASVVTNRNRALAIALRLTGDEKFRAAAVCNADFMLGCNPLGMCWTTGLGYVYPVDIQHEVSETDGIMDPVPGITVYGVTGGPMYYAFRRDVWLAAAGKESDPFLDPANRVVPVWRRWAAHPHINTAQCEFTIHETMSSVIFTAAMLMPEGWKPSAALKARRPRRDDLLFGYWYLP